MPREIPNLAAFYKYVKTKDAFNPGKRPNGQGGLWPDGFYDTIARPLLGSPEVRARRALKRAQNGKHDLLAKRFHEAIVDNVESNSGHKVIKKAIKTAVSFVPVLKGLYDIPAVARYATDGRRRDMLAAGGIAIFDLTPIPGTSVEFFDPAIRKHDRKQGYYALLGMQRIFSDPSSSRSAIRAKETVTRAVLDALKKDEQESGVRQALSHDALRVLGLKLAHSYGAFANLDIKKEQVSKQVTKYDADIESIDRQVAALPQVKMKALDGITRRLGNKKAQKRYHQKLYSAVEKGRLGRQKAAIQYTEQEVLLEVSMLDAIKDVVNKAVEYSNQHPEMWRPSRRGR